MPVFNTTGRKLVNNNIKDILAQEEASRQAIINLIDKALDDAKVSGDGLSISGKISLLAGTLIKSSDNKREIINDIVEFIEEEFFDVTNGEIHDLKAFLDKRLNVQDRSSGVF